MDDLDHSIHIAEYDWTHFYEESDQCCLPQPSLACPDSSNLSDSEDSGNSSSVFSAGQKGPQQNPAANSDGAESIAAGCCMEKETYSGCVECISWQIIQSGTGGGEDDLTTKAQMSLDLSGGTAINTAKHIPEDTDDITATLQTKQLNVQYSNEEPSELKKEDGDEQMESDIREFQSIQERDPLSCNRGEINVNESHTSASALSEDVRGEKERWFVTVNDNPAQQQLRSASVKKKRRQKKKDNNMCRPGQERSLVNGLKLQILKDNYDFEGGTDTEYVPQKKKNLVKSAGCTSDEDDPESTQMGIISDTYQMSLTSGEKDSFSEKLVLSHFLKYNSIEPMIDSISRDTFTPEDPPQSDSEVSDVFEDGVEFFSTHSFDSESYLSASDSVEELQQLLVEQLQLQRSLSLTENNNMYNLTENTDADDTQGSEVHSCDAALSCNVTINPEGHESATTQPTLTSPSVNQSVDKMPDDNSTCDNDTHSLPPSDTHGLQKHERSLLASGCSSGNHLLPVPDLTVTPCSTADSPETYAEAAGHTRPVYAISSFWDEMEKLTINDILQLRMGGRTPARETPVTPNIGDLSSLDDTAEYSLSDGGLMDTSDAADSDYFTQPDESKPGRSSCEFSTSDIEEEYGQFLGASRNSSPDPQSKKIGGTSDSLSFTHEEKSTSSEGKEIPVPSEDVANNFLEDQDSNALILSQLARPRQMTKCKSVHNVQALNTENSSVQLLLGTDESGLCLSSCPPLNENVVLTARESLLALIPATFMDEHYQIFSPELFRYFFSGENTKGDFRCLTVYEPEDISVAPVIDYPLWIFRDGMSFSSLHQLQHSKEKPIPIFSCSHPTVRELTFPNPHYVFLSTDCEDEDDISPIRIVSHAFIQGSDSGAAFPHGFHCWKSLMRKIRFLDKGSIWCGRSGACVFPVEAEEITIKTPDPPITALTERRASPPPSELFRELAVRQRQEGIFSTLKQSDMCLVCIAFASWVLKSSDPEAADAWKAALLANVSALSAIQYLRKYVKKKNLS
ncbi:uncharacterized protein perm1b [Clinocottus analis]|uniref:uncharacterized protein perm1b n=1 Tax=Clinocottus analis TaxID=304258 RepID=UPI0035BF619D